MNAVGEAAAGQGGAQRGCSISSQVASASTFRSKSAPASIAMGRAMPLSIIGKVAVRLAVVAVGVVGIRAVALAHAVDVDIVVGTTRVLVSAVEPSGDVGAAAPAAASKG